MDVGTKKIPIPKCRLYWCFYLVWCSNFVGSESGQKQRVKLLHNMVYNITQHSPSPPTEDRHPSVAGAMERPSVWTSPTKKGVKCAARRPGPAQTTG